LRVGGRDGHALVDEVPASLEPDGLARRPRVRRPDHVTARPLSCPPPACLLCTEILSGKRARRQEVSRGRGCGCTGSSAEPVCFRPGDVRLDVVRVEAARNDPGRAAARVELGRPEELQPAAGQRPARLPVVRALLQLPYSVRTCGPQQPPSEKAHQEAGAVWARSVEDGRHRLGS
jgi:hypothetical protein